jgi:HPt (histidine-containing phosphotransfer) domain-containing protein
MCTANSKASSAGDRDDAAVDLDHLKRYTMGDERLEKEILELFLAQLPQTIGALKAAATDREWKMASHTLKGSGRAIGARRIAQLAEVAEKDFAPGKAGDCTRIIASIESAADEVRAFVAATYK